MLKRKGYSHAFISEAVGHSDPKTTENYLASFELEAKKDASNSLLDF